MCTEHGIACIVYLLHTHTRPSYQDLYKTKFARWVVDRGERWGGGRACLETGGQLTSKHEAVQLVGAVGHEVAFVTYPSAWQAQGRQSK